MLIPILLAVTVALAALYAVYLAPFFVFELVLDAALTGVFYARLRSAEEQN